MNFFTKPIPTISRDECNRVRRESNDHLVVAQEGVALHMCRMQDGCVYVVDEAPKTPRSPERQRPTGHPRP